MVKKVLIIGGTGGVGRGLTPCFDIEKYQVSVVNSRQFPLPDMNFTFMWKDIDVVINLAALTTDGQLHLPNKMNKPLIDLNCLGVVNILGVFLPYMRERKYGRIIMMSSIYAELNVKTQGLYSASKAFVDKIVKIAALENAEFGVTINSIQLGYTGLGMGDVPPEYIERAKNKVGMKRFCTMEELYRTIDFIIETEYLTGQHIKLDGNTR